MRIEPYLFFNGRCDEAIQFYAKTVGAEVEMLARFKEGPNPEHIPPGWGDKVMHAALKIGQSRVLLSDGRGESKLAFENFSLTLMVKDVELADRLFAALAEGGKILMPVEKTFYSPGFGMLTDKFGLMWMIFTENA